MPTFELVVVWAWLYDELNVDFRTVVVWGGCLHDEAECDFRTLVWRWLFVYETAG